MAYAIAELDNLVATRIGVAAELAVLRQLADSASGLAEADDARSGRRLRRRAVCGSEHRRHGPPIVDGTPQYHQWPTIDPDDFTQGPTDNAGPAASPKRPRARSPPCYLSAVGRTGYDIAEMERGEEAIRASIVRIGHHLAELRSVLTPLRATWTGAAADTWDAHQRAWDAAAADLATSLTTLHQLLFAARSNYAAAVEANLRMWRR